MLIKLFNFFRKYGGVFSFYYAFRWGVAKFYSRLLLKKISMIDEIFFKPKITKSKFQTFYKGLEIDMDKLLSGEKRVLFYDRRDKLQKADIKSQWELKRNQEGPILCLIENQTNLNLVESILNESNIESILKHTNAMEVGIAAINIITTYSILSDPRKLIFSKLVSQYLKESLKYIIGNNEQGIRYSHNHYFFNLISILWILESINGNSLLKRLKKRTYRDLKKLLEQMINDDGSLYEGSTYYHKYVTESLFLFLNEFDIRPDNKTKLKIIKLVEKMYHFCLYASYDGKSIVGFGDNDSGRIFALPSYFRYNSTDLKLINKLSEEIGLAKVKFSMGTRKTLKKVRKTKSDFGFYKIEDSYWKFFIRLETNNKNKYRRIIGSHCHNDQLHIVSFYKDLPVFVDKGVYSYVSLNSSRLENLKTSSHNTLTFEDYEQDFISNDWNYKGRRSKGKLLYLDKTKFNGENIDINNLKHQRSIEILSSQIIIKDFFSVSNELLGKNLKIFFHFHPKIRILKKQSNSICFAIKKHVFYLITDLGKINTSNFYYSPEYGSKIKSNVAIITLPISKRTGLITIKINKIN